MPNPLRQYYAGGAATQLMAGATGPTGYNQYAAGGAAGQMKAAAGFAGALDQYAAGGPVGQIYNGGNVTPPTGPTMPQPGQTTYNPWVLGPTGG